MEVTAILLAGGRGSRMSYRNKALEHYRDRPLLRHVIDRIEPQVSRMLISANEPDAFSGYSLPVIPDKLPGSPGPLAGITGCLDEVTSPLTLVVPCDIPNLPTDIVATLSACLGDDDLSVAHDGVQTQWLVFLARTRVLATIEAYRESGRRSARGWIQSRGFSVAQIPEGVEKFRNINTLEDLAAPD